MNATAIAVARWSGVIGRIVAWAVKAPIRSGFLRLGKPRVHVGLLASSVRVGDPLGFLPPPSLLRAPVSLGGHRRSCCLEACADRLPSVDRWRSRGTGAPAFD